MAKFCMHFRGGSAATAKSLSALFLMCCGGTFSCKVILHEKIWPLFNFPYKVYTRLHNQRRFPLTNSNSQPKIAYFKAHSTVQISPWPVAKLSPGFPRKTRSSAELEPEHCAMKCNICTARQNLFRGWTLPGWKMQKLLIKPSFNVPESTNCNWEPIGFRTVVVSLSLILRTAELFVLDEEGFGQTWIGKWTLFESLIVLWIAFFRILLSF